MKRIVVLVGSLLAMLGTVVTSPAQTITGGFAKSSVTEKEVQDAAAYAIEAQAKTMHGQRDGRSTKLELIKILAAEKQVVAGMNYRLKLQVKVNGKDKLADAVVWWQAWRKPNPYELTSWKWAD